jgi:hypothetical protein
MYLDMVRQVADSVAQPDHLNIVLAFVMLARSVSLLDFLNRK